MDPGSSGPATCGSNGSGYRRGAASASVRQTPHLTNGVCCSTCDPSSTAIAAARSRIRGKTARSLRHGYFPGRHTAGRCGLTRRVRDRQASLCRLPLLSEACSRSQRVGPVAGGRNSRVLESWRPHPYVLLRLACQRPPRCRSRLWRFSDAHLDRASVYRCW